MRPNPTFRRALFLAIALWCCGGLPALGAGSLWVVSPEGLSPAEQALLATLQGNLNRDGAHLWVRGRGANQRVLEELEREGWQLKSATIWQVLAETKSTLSGFIRCRVDTESLNVATSLAGPRHAVAADVSLVPKLIELGLHQLGDVTSVSEVEALKQFRSEFSPRVRVHQPIGKALHLRDFAVSRNAFVGYATNTSGLRSRLEGTEKDLRVFGWGWDERAFVGGVSAGGGVVIPSDWALNLSALSRLPMLLPKRPVPPSPAPLKSGERVVAFVVTDGDNIQWLLNGFVDAPGFWASPWRGKHPVTWELAPSLVELAPRVLAHLYRTASPLDDFIAGPSGAGYYFPSISPAAEHWARRTGESLPPSQLNAVSLLNAAGGLEASDSMLDTPEVSAVFFKDYAPYHRFQGAVRWHHDKPSISYRFLLWEQRRGDGTFQPDMLPAGVATAIEALPTDTENASDRFALVNVHAWSFRDSGGPMGAIHRTIERLPPNTRVVTGTEFIHLLKARAANKSTIGR